MPSAVITSTPPPHPKQRETAWKLSRNDAGTVRIIGVVVQDAEVRYANRVPPGQTVPPGVLRVWLDQGPLSLLYVATQPIASDPTHHAAAARTARALRVGTRIAVHANTLHIRYASGVDYLQILGVTLIELLDAAHHAQARTGD